MRDHQLLHTPPATSSSSGSGPLGPTQRPTTVWSVFMQTVLRHSSHSNAVALSGGPQRRHSTTTDTTTTTHETHYSWVQYYERAFAAARALASFRFAPGDGVVMCAKSTPDVHFLNLAAVAVGGVVAHVRASWSVDELVYDIFDACNARVLVLDALHANFVAALQQTTARFRAVILLHGDPMDLVTALAEPTLPVLTMDDLWAVATSANDDVLLDLEMATTPHTCCLMAFAYDEHGCVRGARVSQDNVMFTAATVAASVGPLASEDRLVGYLPLHHVASQVLELYLPLVCAVSVVCAPSYAEPLMKVITGKKPTIFFATPATYARFSTQVYEAKREVNSVLYRWAKTRATNNSKKLLFGQAAHRSLGYMLAKTLVLNNIKKRIGLESCHACYSVLAPLDFELEKLFKTIDIPIYQLFGCAETTGFAALNYPHTWEFGSSGRALTDTVITCDETTQEVLLRGRNVFVGYGPLESTGSTGSTVSPQPPAALERWFRFRQRGFLTPNGFLKINDPQDFVVLASGDWIPVKPYEDALLRHDPALDRVVLVGEGRPFLSVLLFLKVATPPVPVHRTTTAAAAATVATAKCGGAVALGDDALRVGKSIGSPAATVAEAIKCQAWAVHFDETLEALATQCGLSGFFVRKWILMADAFAVESGEIDPDTGAVTRKVVDGKYQSLLDSLYT